MFKGVPANVRVPRLSIAPCKVGVAVVVAAKLPVKVKSRKTPLPPNTAPVSPLIVPPVTSRIVRRSPTAISTRPAASLIKSTSILPEPRIVLSILVKLPVVAPAFTMTESLVSTKTTSPPPESKTSPLIKRLSLVPFKGVPANVNVPLFPIDPAKVVEPNPNVAVPANATS